MVLFDNTYSYSTKRPGNILWSFFVIISYNETTSKRPRWPDLDTVIANIPREMRNTLTIGVFDTDTESVIEYWWPSATNTKDHHVRVKSTVMPDTNILTGMGNIKLWTGTQLEYDAIVIKDIGVLYFVVAETGIITIYKGSI